MSYVDFTQNSLLRQKKRISATTCPSLSCWFIFEGTALATDEPERIGADAIQRLYDQHSTELTAFLLGVLRDRDLVSETLQATFLKAIEAGHTACEETIKGWLFRVAFNEAMSIRRKQTINKKALNKLSQSSMGWLKTGEVGSTKNEGGFEKLCRDETVQQIREAIQTLPAEQQQIVQARIYDQKKFADIAKELGLPLGTVLTRMRLATTKLSARLKPDE